MTILLSRFALPSKLRAKLLYKSSRGMLDKLTNRPISKPLKVVNNVKPSDHFIVLPEPFDPCEGSNELLRIPKIGEPEIQLSKIQTELLYKGLNSRMTAYSNFLIDLQNETIEPHESLEDLIKDIEKYHYPFDSAFYLAASLKYMDSPVVRYKEIDRLMDKCFKMRSKHRSSHIKSILASLYEKNPETVSPQLKHLLKLYFMDNPKKVQLTHGERQNLDTVVIQLNHCVEEFKDNLALANDSFKMVVDDPDILAAVTPNLSGYKESNHSNRAPLEVDINTYDRFMELCPDRNVRKELWLSFKGRCSPNDPLKLNNMKNINLMRSKKRILSNLLGFRSNLELKLQGCMASSRQELIEVLNNLNEENKPKLAARLNELNKFAIDDNMPDPDKAGIQDYDLDYYAYRYKNDILVGRPEVEVKRFFPLTSTIQGIHNFFENYFGIEVRPVDNNKANQPLPSERIQLFSVSRNGSPLGNILLDTHYRHTDRFSYSRVRARNNDLGSLHARLLHAPFKRDPKTNEVELSFSELCNLVYLYGTVMQGLLNNYDVAELNLYGGLEYDAQALLPTLCASYIQRDHRALQMCSNLSPKQQMDADLASKLVNAHNHLKPLKLWRDLYLTHLDVELQSYTSDLRLLVDEAYKTYSPFERHPDDHDFCSMEDIMCNLHDGHQYFRLWPQILTNFWLSSFSPDVSTPLATIKEHNSRLLDTLSDPQEFDTKKKLESLVGRPFEAAKVSQVDYGSSRAS